MPPPAPELTVVVRVPVDAAGLERTLASLAAQTLDPARFEIVQARSESPAAAGGGSGTDGRAVAAAVAQARGGFVTFVDAGDTVAAGYLAAVLALAGPTVLGAAHVLAGETAGADAGAGDPPDLRYGAAATLRPHRTADAAAVALGSLAGTVLPAGCARAAGGLEGDSLFLATAARHGGLELALAPPDADAFYYRHGAEPAVDLDTEVAAVAQLAALDPGTITTGAIDARTDALNRLLREQPERHGEVVARLHGVAGLDWARLNRDIARDIAIVYAALPHVDTSGNIAARRIRALGRPVDVVCADLTGRVAVDPTAGVLWQEYLGDRLAVPGSVTFEGEWAPIAAFCRAALATVARAESAKGPYRSVYSRTMFPAAQLAGALYKIRHPQTPWLAEFSDPQQRDSRGGRRRSPGEPDAALVAELRAGVAAAGFAAPPDATVWEWAELAAYALADTVLFTNEHQRDYMLGYCADPAYAERARAHSEVSHHPVPPAGLYGGAVPVPLDPELVHVAYFGTFYPTRSITEVTDALARLDPQTRALIRLHVFTKHPDRLQDRVGDGLVVHGYLGFTDYLAMTGSVDVLLVGDYRTRGHHDVNPYLPAKYADYAGSGRPIWGLVEPGSVLSRARLDHRSELGDVDGARQVLERIVAAVRPG